MLDENEDNFGDIETTRGSTTSTFSSSTTSPIPSSPSTSTSTRSSTSITHSRSTKRYIAPVDSPASSKTPKTYFSNSFSSNSNQNNLNGQTDNSKVNHNDKGIATFKTKEDIETTTATTASPTFASKRTINPYYNANRVPTTSKRQSAYFTTTARTPYSFQFYTHLTTNQPPLLTTYKSSADENHKSLNNAVETEKQPKPPRSSTYNPVFDVYFKQIGRQKTTTTKRPRSIWSMKLTFVYIFIKWESYFSFSQRASW